MKYLIFAAHADDLELSMGATVNKWKSVEGLQVDLIMLDYQGNSEAFKANMLELGVNYIETSFDRYTPNRDVIRIFDETIDMTEYSMLITHWKEDYHDDHRKCYDLSRQITRKRGTDLAFMNSFPYCSEYKYFNANWFSICNEEDMAVKLGCLARYPSDVVSPSWIQGAFHLSSYWATKTSKPASGVEVFMLERITT